MPTGALPLLDWPSLRYCCSSCGVQEAASPWKWRCRCGGSWQIALPPRFDPASLASPGSAARYAFALRAPLRGVAFLQGMPPTPLEERECDGHLLLIKGEHALPTGSFKARGGAVLVEALQAAGVQHLIEDSSGNAGLAIATYARRAGLRCDLYVPATLPPPKRALLEATGAQLVLVPGTREAVAQAAQHAVQATPAAVYASHVWNPLFLEGVQSFVWELWGQYGGRLPDALVMPAGNGTLLLGAWIGIRALQATGAISRLPQLIGVQAQACAPLVRAWEEGHEEPVAVQAGETQADGIRVAAPARGRQMLAAVGATGGLFLTVSEEQIAEARWLLAGWGYHVEPTGAVGFAGWRRLVRERCGDGPATACVLLTGAAK